MKGVNFQTDEKVYAVVSSTLSSQPMVICTKEIDNLITRWNECVAKEEGHVEK